MTARSRLRDMRTEHDATSGDSIDTEPANFIISFRP
ncbi:hypothetical protein ANO14919_039470 [Xylariales sp. No.14919]|nr:hypothetical protein ANO14919_039470 [Xylariales sp. No.14919]